jgi:ketosteroid isomerase-like protein
MDSKNVQTLRNAHQAFSAKKFDQAQQTIAAQVRFTDHGRGQIVNSQAEFRGWMESHFAMSSDMRIIDARYIDAGDYVIAQFRAVGIQDGPLLAFPATNKPFSLDVCEVWHFNADGQTDEGDNYSDGLGLLMQLGHLPAPR